MEQFVVKTLTKIKKEAPRKFKDLRNVCDDLIGILTIKIRLSNRNTAAITENQKIGGSEREDTDADKYFDPLQAACESHSPKLIEIALDAIHFLIGFILFMLV